MEEKKHIPVTGTVFTKVWNHWKPSFLKSKWSLTAAVIFFSASMALDLLLKPVWWKNVFDALVDHTDVWHAFSMALITAGAAYACSRMGDFTIVLAEAAIIKDLKNFVLKGLMGKSMQFYANHSSGGLVAKTKRFASVPEQVIDEMVLSIIRSVLLVIYLLVFTAYMIPKLTPIFVGWVIIFGTVVFFLSRIRLAYDLASSNADSRTTGLISDTLLSIGTLRIFSASARQLEHFFDVTHDEARKRKTSWFLSNLQWALQSLLVISLEFVCMYIVIHDIQKGVYKVGTAILVQSYIASLAMYMFGLGRSLVKVRTAFADAYEMAELLDQPSPEPITKAQSLRLDDYSIAVDRVSFGYDERQDILRDFSFTFESGTSCGVIGKTGSGKSTLMKLIMHFYEPTRGMIIAGGHDIAAIDKNTLRSLVSFVQQSPVFPSVTIREVISLGKPYASLEEITRAAKQASCDFIWEKPDGLETVIGERGVKLSGGESQRLAIAAAILKDAPIVIMDEPTSALDAVTERTIQRAMKELFKGKTLIVIAHRLSTVASLDTVILLEDGKITDHGPHDELLESSAVYQEMWSLQTDPHTFVHE